MNFNKDQPPSPSSPSDLPQAKIPLNQPTTVSKRPNINSDILKGSSGSPQPNIPFMKLIAMLTGNMTMSINRPNRLVSSSNLNRSVIDLNADLIPPHIAPITTLPYSYIFPKNH